MERFPPRLHVLLASDAPLGVVLRRGPARQVASILWDRRKDTFELGQWLKGRIYERRSDLSPDGAHMIYFALNGRWRSETKGSWTAISRAPYLKALALYGKGDAWNGGGLWTGKRSFWLNDGYGHFALRESRSLKRDVGYLPAEGFGGECPHVYYNRLMRDGWTLVQRRSRGEDRQVDLFERPLRHGWILRKIAHSQVHAPVGNGCYWDEHALLLPERGEVRSFPDWSWADVDRGRLVWASQGRLCAGEVGRSGLVDERVLRDFSDMTFEGIVAPY